jgi:extracellular factor (EF) 3-hydroxypalmitic acid methyl ester biosynthesis protein
MTESLRKEDFLIFWKGKSADIRALPLRFNRFAAVFELWGDDDSLRLSEAIDCFRIVVQGRALYMGRAVVHNLIDTGSTSVCEVTLDDAAWRDLAFDAAMTLAGRLGGQFKEFLGEWQKVYQIRPEYKVIVADMQTFLAGLQLWLQQVELGIQSQPEPDRAALEQAAAEAIALEVVPCVNTLFEKFEAFSETLPDDVLPAHRSYMRRQLHPLVLCSPFANRTFCKPLGYAGDYEMVNMILRNGWEGESLFAKLVNTWFLRQPPAQAHRNRIAYLAERLRDESLRVRHSGGVPRVFNLACGPAHEVQQFLQESFASESVSFTLLDFNQETLRYLETALAAARASSGRRVSLKFILKSVHQLLKESGRSGRPAAGEAYDFVYCAGLFDYLPDPVCRRLTEIMYGWLAPGGLLVATNVEPSNPLRNGMEHLLDWHLIYRTSPELARLRPSEVPADHTRVLADATGTNVFLEIRKPSHG